MYIMSWHDVTRNENGRWLREFEAFDIFWRSQSLTLVPRGAGCFTITIIMLQYIHIFQNSNIPSTFTCVADKGLLKVFAGFLRTCTLPRHAAVPSPVTIPLTTRNPNCHPALSLACIAYSTTIIDSVKFITRSRRSYASSVSDKLYKSKRRKYAEGILICRKSVSIT
jgi:hypothetical protein